MPPAIRILVAKDLRAIFAAKATWLPMFALPLAGSVLLPLIMLYAARHGFTGLATLEMILDRAPPDPRLVTDSQKLLSFGLNRMVPIIFLIIPILATCNIGSVSVVGERQGNTLEALLYAPIGIREIYLAKLAGTFGVAYLITLACFLCFSATAFLGTQATFGFSILDFGKWLMVVLWLCPILILSALGVIVHISLKASSVQSAMQLSSLTVLPVFFLLISQMAGTLSLGPGRIFVLGGVLLALGALLFARAWRGMAVENLV